MRVQRVLEPVLGAQLVELGEHPDQVVPLRRRQREPRRPGVVDDRRRDERRGAGRGEQLGLGPWPSPSCAPAAPRRAARAGRSRRSAARRGGRARRAAPPDRVAGTRARRARAASMPSETISASTRSASSITPQPGTSQTPHEIGPAPIRSVTMASPIAWSAPSGGSIGALHDGHSTPAVGDCQGCRGRLTLERSIVRAALRVLHWPSWRSPAVAGHSLAGARSLAPATSCTDDPHDDGGRRQAGRRVTVPRVARDAREPPRQRRAPTARPGRRRRARLLPQRHGQRAWPAGSRG